MRNHSYENDFDLHENEPLGGYHFHKNGFALRLVSKQRHKRTRKWPISVSYLQYSKEETTEIVNILSSRV